jgi:hypothetical protein
MDFGCRSGGGLYRVQPHIQSIYAHVHTHTTTSKASVLVSHA